MRSKPGPVRAGVAISLAAHIAALWAVPHMRLEPPAEAESLPLTARLIALRTPPPPPAPAARPMAVPASRTKSIARPVVQSAHKTDDLPASVASAEAVTPEQPALPSAPAPMAAAPAVEEEMPPRFDADYLHNPKPQYPHGARRMREEGRVVLRVRVNAEGLPEEVVLRASSGYRRLDQAALDAVRAWRFVPARRGQQQIDAWVLVPVVFALEG